MQLRAQQLQALDKIVSFIEDKDNQVFILKGYAGTGKTTMITALLQKMKQMGKHTLLLAPTGRAAKVLRDKTGHDTRTIHSAIYSMAKIKTKRYDENGDPIKTINNNPLHDKGVDKIEYFFSVRTISECSLKDGITMTPSNTVIIVDEASLISSKPSEGEVLHFGTDVLLDDLLTFSQLHSGTKIIFVGDPAQLPPVGDNKSNALCEEFFTEKGLHVCSAELTDILRQSGDGTILKNAMKIRNLLDEQQRNTLTFDYREGEFESISSDDVITHFHKAQPIPKIGENIIVCFSNSQVKEYNDRIRNIYFPGCKTIQDGDILQIAKNSYNLKTSHDTANEMGNFSRNLYNGDFVKVMKASLQPEHHPVSFWKSNNGKRQKVVITLTFRDVELLSTEGYLFKVKILETLLESDKSSLTTDQHIALHKLFRDMHLETPKDQEAMKAALWSDPYFNAVHAKYGYAITVHKAQGGEWKNAYVDYTGRTGLSDDHLRLAYTATTRAVDHVYAVNAPNITPFSGFSISGITAATKAPKGIVALAEIEVEPEMVFLTNFRRWKYSCAKTRLAEMDCSIDRIDPIQYCDRYHIKTPTGTEIIDCWYSAADIFTRYAHHTPLTDITPEILGILKDESSYKYDIKYTPSYKSLEDLWHKVVSTCDELNIQIMNVQEFIEQYYVLFSFKTSGQFSTIQFYFKNDGAITRALPSSDLGFKDELLASLIIKLSK